MTPEQLKASIIFSALQGKLVEQIDEEPSVDTSKIKSKKTEAIEFDIPEKWKVAHIETVTTSIASKQYQIAASEFKTEGKHPVVSQSKEYVIGYCDDDSKLFHHEEPVVIFGDHTTEVKYIDFDFVVGADGVKIFEPISNVLFVKFLKYVLEFYSTGLENVGGYTRHYKYIKDKALPLPPLEEQYRIVAKIEELLPLVDRYAASYEKLEQFNAKFPEDMKKSILQYAIQGKLVEQRPEEGSAEELYKAIQEEKQKLIKEGKIKKEKPLAEITEDEIPFDIPESWRWVRFAEFGSYKKGPFGSALTKSMFVPKGKDTIKVYEQKNAIQKDATLGEYYITKEYYEKSMTGFEVHSGDVIVSCAGTIGETFIMPDNIEKGIINQALMRMQLMPSVYKPYFLLFFDVVLKKNAIKSSKGSAIKNIPPFDELKAYLVPLPPLAEQHRIVAKIEELLPYCDRLVKRC